MCICLLIGNTEAEAHAIGVVGVVVVAATRSADKAEDGSAIDIRRTQPPVVSFIFCVSCLFFLLVDLTTRWFCGIIYKMFFPKTFLGCKVEVLSDAIFDIA